MNLDTLKDLYIHELKDLHSAEKQLIKALPKMAKSAANADLHSFPPCLMKKSSLLLFITVAIPALAISQRTKNPPPAPAPVEEKPVLPGDPVRPLWCLLDLSRLHPCPPLLKLRQSPGKQPPLPVRKPDPRDRGKGKGKPKMRTRTTRKGPHRRNCCPLLQSRRPNQPPLPSEAGPARPRQRQGQTRKSEQERREKAGTDATIAPSCSPGNPASPRSDFEAGPARPRQRQGQDPER